VARDLERAVRRLVDHAEAEPLGGVKVDRVQPDAGPPDHPYAVGPRGQPIGV